MKIKKILIFGATGQIGKELAFELKNSNDIEVLCHSRTMVGSSFFNHHEIKQTLEQLLFLSFSLFFSLIPLHYEIL